MTNEISKLILNLFSKRHTRKPQTSKTIKRGERQTSILLPVHLSYCNRTKPKKGSEFKPHIQLLQPFTDRHFSAVLWFDKYGFRNDREVETQKPYRADQRLLNNKLAA